jgi:polyphosphate kinase 2 (PPK2 family)
MIRSDILNLFRLQPGKKVRMKDHDTGWAQTKELKELGKDVVKDRAKEILDKNLEDLSEAQELLYADDRYAVLIVLQAMDAAGKDGTIKHVMSGVNPQGCQVFSFKKPSPEELDHNFLWRYMKRVPERGRIGIFNRSYYEDVLVVKVHPELLDKQKLPPGKRDKSFWEARYEDINAFERHLTRNGIAVLKFFLNVSKEGRDGASSSGSSAPRRTGSFPVPTSWSASSGQTTWTLTRMHWRQRPRRRHPGKWSRPTRNGSRGPSSPTSSRRRFARSTLGTRR